MFRRRAVETAPVLFTDARGRLVLPKITWPAPRGREDQDRADYIQRLFDAAAPRPAVTLPLMARLRAGEILDEVFIATHVLRENQAATINLLRSRRFAAVPKLALISPWIAFNLVDAGFARAADANVYSRAGEIWQPFVARKIYLIGGEESICLRQSIRELSNQALTAGLTTLEMHVLTDHTYGRGVESMQALRDDRDFSAARRAQLLQIYFFDWKVDPDSFEFIDGHLHARAVHHDADNLHLTIILE